MAKNIPTPPGDGAKSQNEEQTTFTAEDATLVENNEKMYKVKALEDHKCSIGGRKYYLRKHGEYELPESDARILQNANKVMIK